MTYDPSTRRVGEASPQTSPELFTDAELMTEVRYLMRLNKRHGSHPLRTAAYMRLLAELDRRKAAGES